MNISVLYESKDFMVIDKPAGMVVHPSETGQISGTVVDVLSKKIGKNVGDKFRPGVVHRLDKNTSGLLIIAKTEKGYDYFVEQFKKRTIKKIYLALVKGILEYKEAKIDSPIGRSIRDRKKMDVVGERTGKRAVSVYKVLEEFEFDKGKVVSLVEVDIKTGRTHQIRVHMSSIGHPVVGDDTYGIRSFNRRFEEKFGLKRQFLHAHEMKFKDPGTGKTIEIKSDLPKDLKGVLRELKDI